MTRTARKSSAPRRGTLAALFPLTLIATAAAAQQLEEIIVTATKRELTLQEVPLSITAFSGAQLERMGATDFFDYATRVPNLGFGFEADGRFDSRKIGIRGIFGAGLTAIGGTTGFYLDEVPVPETMNPRINDLDRVEVLRGPQGTLYGARSMGGTVRLISKQPDMTEYEGRAHAGFSSVEDGDLNWLIDGAVNVPIVDNRLGMRALIYYSANSGVFDRVNTPTTPGPAFSESDVDDEHYYGTQIAFTWQALDNLTVTPRFIFQRVEADGLPFADIDPESVEQQRNYNIREPGNDTWMLGSVTLSLDTAVGTFVSSTARFDRAISEDEDETEVIAFFFAPAPPLPGVIKETVDFEALVHETRFASDFGDLFGGRVEMTAGVFYQDTYDNLKYPPALVYGLDREFTLAVGAPYPPGLLGTDLIFQTRSVFESEEIALFGEVTITILDWLRFTGGARWSDIETHQDVVADGIVNNGPTSFLDMTSESSVNPKFLIEADATEDILLYAAAGKGFRLGGNNANLPFGFCAADLAALGITSPDQVVSFESDTVWNYEGGFKSTWFDNRLTLNATGFFIDWDDIQQFIRLACGFQFVANSGKAESKGFELEAMATPVEGLELTLGVGYVDAEITEGRAGTGFDEGDRIQQVPDWTLNLSGQYTFPLRDNWDAFVRADFSHYGDSLSANNDPNNPRKRPAFELLNLRAGAFIADRWEAAVFLDNVTDERANLADNRSIAAETPGRPRIVTNRPRTVGLEVRASW
jgi:outer membrane receptor protein involved in Fe transport